MGDSVRIDLEGVRDFERRALTKKDEYAAEIKNVYAGLEKMRNGWKGPDSDEMQAKIAEAEATIKGLEEVIGNIGIGLGKVANTYEKAISEMKDRSTAV